MHADNELAVGLIRALLANARDLAAEARLLFEHDRYARAFALAALAGEELGKVAICLDWVFGDTTTTPKETRQAWVSHNDKIASLIAYRAAFIEEPSTFRPEQLRDQATTVAGRKMQAIYVDLQEGTIHTPEQVSRDEANELLTQVEVAVNHASAHLGPISEEVAVAIGQLAPFLVTPLSEHLDSLSPANALDALRNLLTQASTLTDQQWADAVRTDGIEQLVSVLLGAPPARTPS